jgi:hypothetical protein
MKTKLLVVFAFLVALILLPLGPAQASDAYERYTEWYSDATHTQVVGWRQEYCNGTMDADGYQSAYHQSWNGDRCVEGGGGGAYVCYGYNTLCPAQCYSCI